MNVKMRHIALLHPKWMKGTWKTYHRLSWRLSLVHAYTWRPGKHACRRVNNLSVSHMHFVITENIRFIRNGGMKDDAKFWRLKHTLMMILDVFSSHSWKTWTPLRWEVQTPIHHRFHMHSHQQPLIPHADGKLQPHTHTQSYMRKNRHAPPFSSQRPNEHHHLSHTSIWLPSDPDLPLILVLPCTHSNTYCIHLRVNISFSHTNMNIHSAHRSWCWYWTWQDWHTDWNTWNHNVPKLPANLNIKSNDNSEINGTNKQSPNTFQVSQWYSCEIFNRKRRFVLFCWQIIRNIRRHCFLTVIDAHFKV